jgi:CDP-glycerol glycerophosphotransferase (TagB/SpsB family)
MISDFSGIIFDYMFLCDRPVLYVNQNFDSRPYDADDLDHELWQFKIIKEAGIELKEEDFPQITEIIKKAGDSESLSSSRKTARETAWQYPGEAGKRIVDFMLSEK